jgi:hypothetical protein
VNTRSDLPTRSALTAGRFVVLVVFLFGFIVMHGLAATHGDGTHHSPLALPTPPGVHGILSTSPSTAAIPGDGLPDHGDADHDTAEDSHLAEAAVTATGRHGESGGGEGSHGAMVGCLIAVCALVIITLALPHRGTLTRRARELAALRHLLGGARPEHRPPRLPSRISLCVLRV